MFLRIADDTGGALQVDEEEAEAANVAEVRVILEEIPGVDEELVVADNVFAVEEAVLEDVEMGA